MDPPAFDRLSLAGRFPDAPDLSDLFHPLNAMTTEEQKNPTGLAENMADRHSSKAILGAVIGWGFVILAIIAAVITYAWNSRNPRCNNGVLMADMIGIAPRVSGPINDLPIKDNQMVHKGDLLYQIKTAPYEIAVQSANANLAMAEGALTNAGFQIAAQQAQVKSAEASQDQAQAKLATAKDNYERIAPLLAKHYASAQDVSDAKNSMQAALAGVASAQAQVLSAQSSVLSISEAQAKRDAAAASLAQAELNLKYCTVKAPFDALISQMSISRGAYAAQGQQVFTLIDTHSWWVCEPFREGQLNNMKVGDPVTVELKTAAGKYFKGTVESIGWGATPQALQNSILPVIPQALDWVQLEQRFPVRIKLADDVPAEILRVGTTAAATVHTGR
ncbi:MAG: biotin/lipoyl-binding protein [Proteobacteria bacterium]|jgi:multidrug efflux system membrane fusion protein|nr:biotin/lipoyl-binding protein [Pseudomonadota bacterium]